MAEVADDSGLSRTGETAWVFGTIEESFTRTRAGHEVRGFPGLVDEGATVGLRVFGSQEERDAHHRLGVARLLLLALPSPDVLGSLDNTAKLALAGSPYASVAALVEDCRAAVVRAAVDAAEPVRDLAAYDALAAGIRLDDAVGELVALVIRVLDGWRAADRLLGGRADMTMLPALTDMKAQLDRLVHDGFVADAGPGQLGRYPTYLRALTDRRARLDEGGAAVNRDRLLMERIAHLQEAYLHQVDALPDGRPPGERLGRVRWMLEEYRVSLWAQQLGTPYPVSDQRIRKALDVA